MMVMLNGVALRRMVISRLNWPTAYDAVHGVFRNGEPDALFMFFVSTTEVQFMNFLGRKIKYKQMIRNTYRYTGSEEEYTIYKDALTKAISAITVPEIKFEGREVDYLGQLIVTLKW